MPFANVYEDAERAASYARIGFPGTYHLAFRDLPDLFAGHVSGRDAVDFGCDAGRSTRFLRRHGFAVVGIDISEPMLRNARELDPGGAYVRIADGGLYAFRQGCTDLALSAFAFDNIPGVDHRVSILSGLRALLRPDGCIMLIVSAPALYVHEWVSFTTRDFPENRTARSGEPVRIVMKDVADTRPINDLIWFDDEYRRQFARAGLEAVATHRPVGTADEPHDWINEERIAPWTIYVLRAAHH